MRQTTYPSAPMAPFRLGDRQVEPGANEIAGRRIDAKAMEVLVCLAEAAPAVVTHTALLEQVWPTVVVGDNVLHQAVANLRKALGDDARSPRCIETIPRRGYRLLMPVERETGMGNESAAGASSPVPTGSSRTAVPRTPWIAGAALVLAALLAGVGAWYGLRGPQLETGGGAAIAEHSIVVLPFVNVGADPEQEYFSDGLSEELINLLARNPELKVTSRTSAFHFKNPTADLRSIAAQLGVAHVLEGSVRKSGNTIRVSVQLVEAATDTQVWSETYDRPLGDVLVLQDEIAAGVLAKLRLTFLRARTTRHAPDTEAYLRFLEARYLLGLDRDDMIPRASALLNEALTIDPGFVRGSTELARVHFRRGDLETARSLVMEALDHEPDDPVANAFLGVQSLVLPLRDHNLAHTAMLLRRALAAEPTNDQVLSSSVFLLIRLGRHADAVRVGQWVVDRDPMCVVCRGILGQAHTAAGHFTEAQRVLEDVVQLAPEASNPRAFLAWSQLFQGKARAALATLEGFEHPHPAFRWLRTFANRELGDRHAVPSMLAEREAEWENRNPDLLAMGHALSGDPDAAFHWLERSLYVPLENVTYPHFSAGLAPLHGDPRWPEFLERLGLLAEQLSRIEFDVVLPVLK
jgi:TolB-like protein/DNA-binding winged helix-turn-helix (wHTH) protein/Flp pilus assembly protein TadD